MGMSPKITQIDPNSPQMKPLQGAQSGFLQGVYQGQNPFQGAGNPLQTQAVGQLGQFLHQAAPEQKALTASQGALHQQLGMQPGQFGANPFQQMAPNAGPAALSFGRTQLPAFGAQASQMGANPFREMLNPFQQQGAVNPGQQVIQAAQPVFQQNLRAAQTQLGNAAPGRFSSAFVSQGQDLASKALGDFNLFQAQALQQGQAQQLAAQQAAQQFMLGARGLQQQAVSDARQGMGSLLGLQQQGALGAQQLFQQGNLEARDLAQQNLGRQDQFNLGARGLQQQAWGTGLQNQLGLMGAQQGAASALGGLSAQAGMNPFNRFLGAGNLGAQLTMNQINPLLQLMLGGLQYGKPAQMDTVVGKSGMEQLSQLMGSVGGILQGVGSIAHP